MPLPHPELDASDSWQGEKLGTRKNGDIYPMWSSVTGVRNSRGELTHYVAAITDLSQRKQNEERIQQLAFHDPLTQLPNRRLLLDRLEHALVGALRNHTGGAVLLIDVDNFKALNDTRGHDVGDMLLRQIGQRLLACVHESDTVARISGDEFVVLFEDMPQNSVQLVSQVRAICAHLLHALEQPYDLGASATTTAPA